LFATAGQFTATINWGDGTTLTGTISVDPQVYQQFDVAGTHTYTVPGSFPVFVTISDAGGQSTTAQASATVTTANSALEAGVEPETDHPAQARPVPLHQLRPAPWVARCGLLHQFIDIA
jgi:hypothetical protein